MLQVITPSAFKRLCLLMTIFGASANYANPGGVVPELWLKADAGVIASDTNVSMWLDQSATGYNMSDTDALPYQYLLNVLNGYPVLSNEDGAERRLTNSSSIDLRSFSIALKPNSPASCDGIIGHLDSDLYNIRNCSDDNWAQLNSHDFAYAGRIWLNGLESVTLPLENSPQIISAESSALVTFANGIEISEGSRSRHYPGYVAEIIGHDTVLTDKERWQTESYLALKYGMTLDPISTPAYILSTGHEVWKSQGHAYQQRIFGLVNDSGSLLNNTASKSTAEDAMLKASTNEDFSASNLDHARPSFLEGNAVVFGSNSGNTGFSGGHSNRRWLVQNTEVVGRVHLAVNQDSPAQSLVHERYRVYSPSIDEWSYSSVYSAALNDSMLSSEKAWAPHVSDTDVWAEIPVPDSLSVVGIVTASRRDLPTQHFGTYTLQAKRADNSYVDIEDGKVFDGNNDSDRLRVTHFFNAPTGTVAIKINVKSWAGTMPALRAGLLIKGTGGQPSVLSSASFSSVLNDEETHASIAINSSAAWRPATENVGQEWVEMSLAGGTSPSAIITQGNQSSSSYVTSYIAYAVFANGSMQMLNDGAITANADSNSEVRIPVAVPAGAISIRLIPQTWVGDLSMRAGIEWPATKHSIVYNPAEVEREYSATYGNRAPGDVNVQSRLGSATGWVPASKTSPGWIRVPIPEGEIVTGVITQGHRSLYQWVTSYKLEAELNDGSIVSIADDLVGNTERNAKVSNEINVPDEAVAIIIKPKTWQLRASMRVGLLLESTRKYDLTDDLAQSLKLTALDPLLNEEGFSNLGGELYLTDGTEITVTGGNEGTATLSDNHPPHSTALSSSEFAENNDPSEALGQLSSVDADGDALSYSLVNGVGDDDNASFQLVGNQLFINHAADYEKQDKYSIRIRVADNDGGIYDSLHVIDVTDVVETLSAPTLGTTANENGTLTVAGTGEPGAEVSVTFPDGSIITATVDAEGNYSITSTAPQGSGDVSVSQTDADGNTSTATAEGFTDNTPPATPTSGTTANVDGTLTVTGTGEPGAEVYVTFPDGTKGTAIVDAEGNYSITSAAPQGTGEVSITQTDKDGNTSTATAEGFTDTTPPASPTSGTTANEDGTLTVAGTGEPGAEVSVTFPDGSKGTATVGTDGSYAVTSEAPQGTGEVSITQTDKDGNTSTATAEGFTDTTPPAAPTSGATANENGTLTVAGTGEPGVEIEVTFPDGSVGTATVDENGNYSLTSAAPQGTGEVSITQTDKDGNTSTATAEGFTDTTPPAKPTSGTTANEDGTLTVAGTGEPGSEVSVTFPDGSVGKVTVSTDGTYSVTSETPQGSGDVSVAQTDKDGNTSTATAEGFTDTTPPASPTSGTTANADGTLTVAGTGEPGAEVEVTFPDGSVGKVTVSTDGTYSVTSATPQGTGEVSITQTDKDGNTSTATAEGFTDTTPPATPTSGTTANVDGTLTVAGTGEPGAEVEVTFPDGSVGKVTVSTDGTYSLTSATPQGTGEVSITQTDADGNTSTAAAEGFTDTTPPATPTSGTTANENGTLTVAGTGEPGSEVSVTFPDGSVGKVTVSTDGTYSVTSETPQGSGDVSVAQTDADGNTSTAAAEGFTDTTPPASPTSGTSANEDGTLTVAGTGEPGAEVSVTFPDGTTGTATVDENGNYSITSATPQGSGDVSVSQTDADGNTSTATAEGFTDTTPPATPTSGTTANENGTLTVAGTGEPGSEVEVTFPDGSKGTATVDAEGNYSITSVTPQGTGDLSVAQTDKDGNTSTASAEGFTDTTPPAAPTSGTTANEDGTLSVAGTGEPGSEVSVTFPDGSVGTVTVDTEGNYSITSTAPQGSGDVSVAQTDADGNTSTATAEGFTDTTPPAAPTSGTTANEDGTLTVAGTGEPGAEIEVTFPDGSVGKVTVSTDGTYSLTSATPQGTGEVSITQTDKDGNTSTASAEGFTDTTPPATPTSGTTANGDGTLTVTGTGEPGAEIEVTFPDGSVGKVTVSADGTYSVTSATPQGTGEVSITQTDKDGNTSTATAEGFTDTTPPAIPTSGTTANEDGTLTVAGTGEPGSEVEVTFPDGSKGTATVDAEGNYSITSSAPQGTGEVSITQTDKDGNTSTATAEGFTDTTPPAAPTSGTTANEDGTLTVTGTGEPGAEIEVTFPDGSVGKVTVSTDGTYSVTSEAPQGSGDVSVAQTDADGNTSTATAEGFTDTTPPATPKSGTTANENGTLTVAGTGEPGAEVSVTFPDGTTGTATVDENGNYSITSATPQGSGDVSVSQTDADGNTSTATAEGFTDTTPPATPTSGTTANENGTLTVAGTGEPGAEVSVTFPDGSIITATVDAEGNYSITSTAPQGSGDVSVSQTDADGNTSTATAEGFTDNTPPATPTLGATANEDGTLTVAGTGEPGSEVEVTFPDGSVGKVTVSADGTYSVTSATPQGTGEVSITQTDKDGNTSTATAEGFTDTTPPATPTLGATANEDGTLTVAGTGEPGSEVEVTFPDGSKGTATVDAEGNYSITSSAPQGTGEVSITQTDKDGNTSTATAEGFTDTTPPATPTSGTTANADGTLTVAGTGEPGAEVEVTFPDGSVGKVTVSTDGTYSLTSATPQGTGEVSITQTDKDGNTSTATAEGFTDTTPPATPTSGTTANVDGTLTVAGTGEPGAEVEVTFPDGSVGKVTVSTDGTYSLTSATPQGTGEVSITQTDKDGNTSTATAEGFTDTTPPATPTSGTTANEDGTLTVAGTGEPGAEIEVTFPDGTKGTATVDENGNYSITSATPQGSGDVSVSQTDADGNTSTATAEGFTDTTPPATPTSGTTANENGTLTVAGTGEPGSEVEVTFPDGLKGTATVDAEGNYSITSSAPQGTGEVSITQTDKDGNTSTATAEGFTDTTPPATPTSGTTANADGTLTVAGTGEPGAEIEVTFPDGSVGKVTVSADGTYSVTSATPQGTGEVSITQTDKDGNTSTATAEGFTDTTPPAIPTSGTTANEDGTLTVAGTGEPGAEVYVTFPDGTKGTAIVDAEGNYSITSAAPQGTGEVSITQTDKDGNTSTATAEGFTDTTPPATPTLGATANEDGTLTVAGTGEPGSEVSVTFPDGSVGKVTVSTDGTYSVTSETPQGSGDVSVAQTDADGNTSTAAAEGFTDTTPPVTPTSGITANENGTLTVAGTGEPGSEVSVTFPDGSIITATVDAEGNYSIISATPQGTGEVSITQTDKDGNTSTATAEGFTDTTPPATPTSGTTANVDGTLTVAGTGEPGAEVEVTFPDGSKGTATVDAEGNYIITSVTPQGTGDLSVAQTDKDGNTSTASAEGFTDTTPPAAPTSGTTANEDGTLSVAGTGEPGSEVSVTFPDGSVGTVTVDTEGNYSITSTAPQGSGDVSVAQTDADGNTSTATAEGFTDTTPPAIPTSGTTANENGTLTVAGTGEPGSEVSVTFPDGSVGKVTVSTDGTYSVTSATPQGTGEVSITQTDKDGNTSTATADGFTDTTPPATPTSGTTANVDGTLTVAGTGEPGAEIEVTFPDGSVGKVTVSTDGTYSVTSATPQGTGDVSITQTDKDGNTSTATAEGFTDTTPPATPTSGTTANENGTLTVAGTGEPGSEVSVTFPDGTTGTATVDAEGNYSITSSAPQGTGEVSITQTDKDGNTSTATAEGFTDTTPPKSVVSGANTDDNGNTVVNGTGEPGALVTVTFPDGSQGAVIVAVDGHFTISSETPQGSGSVAVLQTDKDGNASITASIVYNFDTPSPDINGTRVSGVAPPGAPVTAVAKNGETCQTVADADGRYRCDFVADVSSHVNVEVGIATSSNVTSDGHVEGTSEPGATITVSDPATGASCSAVVDVQGAYSCQLNPAPVNGADIKIATVYDASSKFFSELPSEQQAHVETNVGGGLFTLWGLWSLLLLRRRYI